MNAVLVPTTPARPSRSALHIADGTLEALKWIALILMTGDHINAYLFDWRYRPLYDAGRLVMPIFGFVLAYNLARPSCTPEVMKRIIKRLLCYGLLAVPAYIHLHGYWPFNILVTLALFVFIVRCLQLPQQRYTVLAMAAFALGGLFVEFWWFALAFCLASWWFCKSPHWLPGLALLSAAASLAIVNHNYYAMLALPLMIGATQIEIRIPRLQRWFYVYYPVHLTMLSFAGVLIEH